MDRELWKWVDPKSSIVSEWDLVCSHEYKVQLADSIFFVGFLAELEFSVRLLTVKVACLDYTYQPR